MISQTFALLNVSNEETLPLGFRPETNNPFVSVKRFALNRFKFCANSWCFRNATSKMQFGLHFRGNYVNHICFSAHSMAK